MCPADSGRAGGRVQRKVKVEGALTLKMANESGKGTWFVGW